MAINFKKYCEKFTTDQKITIDASAEVPDTYKSTMKIVVNDIRTRLGVIDHTPVGYIQDELDAVDDVDGALRITAGDIPDGLLEGVSNGLYGKSFNDVTIEEQSIIIITSMYICVAKNRSIN